MLEYLTLGEFVVATLMSLAALCAFVWGAATGAFQGGEAIKHQVLRVEAQCELQDAGLGPHRPRRAYEFRGEHMKNSMSDPPEHHPKYGEVEQYAGGEIRSYRGIVNKWLLLVYAVLAVWGIYYLFRHWGGLGPGLAVGQ